MSTNYDTERHSAVNVLRLAFATLTVDNKTTLTYNEVTELDNVMISAKFTPKMNTGKQFASGQEYDSYVAKAGGQLDIQIPALNQADEKMLFGCSEDSTTGVLTENKSDKVPNVMTIYSTETSTGKINLYKFPKCKFTDQGESAQTTDENGITYNSQTISASYSALLHGGDSKYVLKGLDPTTDAAIITAWFATATGGLPT